MPITPLQLLQFSLWDFGLYRRVSMSKEIQGERYNGGGGERKK